MSARFRRSVAPALAVLLVALTCAAPAGAQGTATALQGSSTAASPTQQTLPGGLIRPGRIDVAPPGRVRTAQEVLAIAQRVPKVREAQREHPGSTREAFLKDPGRWQVSYIVERRGVRTEIAQVLVDDLSGAVLEAWTGYQVPWTMARGYSGAFGRGVNSPWVWLPLCVLFAVPFIDIRNPFRMRHLDLLVLTGFSVALAFFNAAKVGVSTPLVVPLLVYLLIRMLHIGLSRRDPAEQARRPLQLLVPVSWLAIATVFLIGFRIGLNVTDSNVIDVGYAGVVGADHITGGEPLYGDFPDDNEHGNTYGPVNYLAYVPFEQLAPWKGTWDDLPAAHGAALVFDLAVVALLFFLGRRIRGPGTGVVLAYTWVAFPFSLFVSNTNANDALPAALVLAALLAMRHPIGRGVLIALAGLTKFAPLALVPLFARAKGSTARFALGFVVTALVVSIPIFVNGGTLREFWDATIGYQADRASPFSIYGLWGGLGWLRTIVEIGTVALGIAVAFLPRRRDLVGVAALAAAVLVAVQLSLSYWFFLYVAWMAPLVFIALLCREGEPVR
jgi:hypothetical protein